MQAAILPPLAGWHWARDGFAIFRKQPIAMFMWAMAITLFVSLAAATPRIGPLFFVAFMPVVTLLTLSACKHIAADRVMLPSMWFKPLKQPGVFRKLVGMGLMYGVISLTAGLAVSMPFARDIADAFVLVSAQADLEPLIEAVWLPLLAFTVVYVVLAALFWHAPALTAWHHIKLTQSLFYSGIACWRNKLQFLVYGATWFGVFFVIDLAAGALIWLELSPSLVQTLQMPFNIAAGGALYCSFYPAYVSVFDIENRPAMTDTVDPQ